MGKSKGAYYSGVRHKVGNRYKKHHQAAAVDVAGLNPKIYSAVFAGTIFTSATLLFMVQPMIAKMLLPLLGGVPAVWTTCMVFFQLVLLGGYFYAHQLTSRCKLKNQAIIHLCLLLVAAIALPIGVFRLGLIASDMNRIVVVLALLALSVGLPFFALSASAPLIQKWFSRTGHPQAEDPYFLYAASNFGSMVALIAYPTLIEPNVGLHLQSQIWTVGYVILFGFFASSGYLLYRVIRASSDEAPAESAANPDEEPSFGQKGYWVALAFVPSSMMLGVTTYFTTDIATIPLLWIIPLTLYLVSFTIVFSKVPAFVQKTLSVFQPVVVVGLLCLMISREMWPILSSLFFHIATFFVVALVFHGEIARTRPSPEYLTKFYLLMSLGGVLGGIFNGIFAPIIFKTAAEYPIALVLACLLMPTSHFSKKRGPRFSVFTDAIVPLAVGGVTAWFAIRWPLLGDGFTAVARVFNMDPVPFHQFLNYAFPAAVCLGMLFTRRSLSFGLAVAAFTFASFTCNRMGQDIVHLERSFFGILKVSNDYGGQYRTLTNGTTLHGRQSLEPATSQEPLTYYHRQGPVGQIFQEFTGSSRLQSYAAIGLGTGTLSAYGQRGMKLTIYEIDKAVRRIATEYFTFLKNCAADWHIEMGDARLKLSEAKGGSYGLILVDAFSSDAIPVHLLTKEAVALYFEKVTKDGLVAIHTSNRYLTLEPILGNIAKELHLTARVNHDAGDEAVGKLASTWVILTRDEASLGKLSTSAAWQKLEPYSWFPTWTDDFTSVISVLK